MAAVLSVLLVSAPRSASAGACGDDVDGVRVPCACGDVVVSDTALSPADPVTAGPCSGDGLIVLAPTTSDGITLNLGGQSIVGSGSGAGIRVARGGKLGSIIVGGDAEDTRAQIARFDTGIRAMGRNAVREVRALDLIANKDDGLKIRSSGVRVEDIRSEGNGRDGISVSGHGNEIVGVVSTRNVRDGLQVRGAGSTVSAETSDNRRNGTLVGGRGNTAESLRTSNNGGAGVLATGTGHEIGKLESSENSRGDVTGRPGAVE